MGKPDRKSHLEDVDIDGKIILKWIWKAWNGIMNWIDVAHDNYKWQALVSAVMNLRVP